MYPRRQECGIRDRYHKMVKEGRAGDPFKMRNDGLLDTSDEKIQMVDTWIEEQLRRRKDAGNDAPAPDWSSPPPPAGFAAPPPASAGAHVEEDPTGGLPLLGPVDEGQDDPEEPEEPLLDADMGDDTVSETETFAKEVMTLEKKHNRTSLIYCAYDEPELKKRRIVHSDDVRLSQELQELLHSPPPLCCGVNSELLQFVTG